jgi:hypothetical protein
LSSNTAQPRGVANGAIQGLLVRATEVTPRPLCEQLLPGTFEYTLHHTIDEIDLSVFDVRYRNDDAGAPAYDPRVLLKSVLFAYSRGLSPRAGSGSCAART